MLQLSAISYGAIAVFVIWSLVLYQVLRPSDRRLPVRTFALAVSAILFVGLALGSFAGLDWRNDRAAVAAEETAFAAFVDRYTNDDRVISLVAYGETPVWMFEFESNGSRFLTLNLGEGAWIETGIEYATAAVE